MGLVLVEMTTPKTRGPLGLTVSRIMKGRFVVPSQRKIDRHSVGVVYAKDYITVHILELANFAFTQCMVFRRRRQSKVH